MSEQKELSQLATFLQHLINAGMSVEEAIKQGFEYAQRAVYSEYDFTKTSNDKAQEAAQRLEEAAKEIGLHISQQRTNVTRAFEKK